MWFREGGGSRQGLEQQMTGWNHRGFLNRLGRASTRPSRQQLPVVVSLVAGSSPAKTKLVFPHERPLL
jgi:hypothetical protein